MPAECLICRARAKLSLVHRDTKRRSDLWWADACGDKHMRQIRAAVFNLPGWKWRVEPVGATVTAARPERKVKPKIKAKARAKA